MRSSSVHVCFVCVLLSVLVLSIRNCGASSDTNSTKLAVGEEDDESLEKTTLDEFKERYRRLIPYLTFYVVNNVVGEQVPTQQSTTKDSRSSPSAKQNLQLSARFLQVARKDRHRANVQSQERKFVPSVQYDPHSLGSDNDYFMPVRYNSKASYDDYPSPYQTYQDRKTMYPEVSTPSSQVAANENRYYANVRPLRPYATNGRNHLPRKQLANKPSLVRDDYVLDYNARPTSDTNYPIKDYQGHRYIPSSGYSSLPALESITGKPPPMVPQLQNPNVNLDQIIESLHLSERLPEMLNKDNIDVSLKTLVEILNILHNTKNELLEMRPPPLPPLVSPSSRQKVTNFKARPQTRPKVITESRFQATPNPLYLTEDPERYKATSPYEDGIKSKVLAAPSYASDGLNNNKVVEYYLPVVQDVSEKGKEVFLPTIRTQVDESSTGHSYEIVEDPSDDVLQQEHYTLSPPITESSIPSYTESKKIPQQTITETKHGATRGEAHVDYPAYSNIPFTNFSCKEQRYKGFFGDPDTGCQVWHYCDLNGGKSSFLCPNGTIFSQVALTCDWWFNVKCETTTQLYVLNERLYKYILPVMPKFPEDFTGPEVDRYLEIKFKEMEKKLKEKLKKEEQEKLKEKAETRKEDE